MQENYKEYAGSKQEVTTEELVKQYQITKNDEYLEEVIRNTKKLIIKWANSYLNIPNSEQEDLISEAYIALLKAVKNFDPSKGYAFTTCLKGYVLQHYNRLYYNATRLKRNDFTEVSSYEDLVENNIDSLTATTENHSNIELMEYLEGITNDNQKTIIKYLIWGYSKSDIAKVLHITPASISYHIKAIGKSYSLFVGGAVA